MTYASSTNTLESDRESIRRAVGPAAAAVTIPALGLTAWSAHDMTEIVVVFAVIMVTVAAVYGVVLPRALRKPSAGGTALALSVPAVLLTLPAFWSGLPLVLGVAGAMTGYAGRNAPSGSGKCIAGLALGVLAAIGYLAIYVVDGWILGNA